MDDILVKYITKNKMEMQNQRAFIHNLENQVEQIVSAFVDKPQDTLPRDTENNLQN